MIFRRQNEHVNQLNAIKYFNLAFLWVKLGLCHLLQLEKNNDEYTESTLFFRFKVVKHLKLMINLC